MMRLRYGLALASIVILSASASGCFGCGADTNVPEWYDGPHEAVPDMAPGGPMVNVPDGGTIMHVALDKDTSIDGSLVGNDVTLLAAPPRFSGTVHVTSVNRPSHPVHTLSDLKLSCEYGSAPGDVASFSGTFELNPFDQGFLDQAILNSDANKIEKLTSVYVVNAPSITAARSGDPDLDAAINEALPKTPYLLPFTSNNWQLLCNTFEGAPSGLKVQLTGTFASWPYSGEVDLEDFKFDLPQ